MPEAALQLDGSSGLSLRRVLILPFLLQLFAAVALTGWLSLTNGQKAVDEAIAQLRAEIGRHVHEYLADYLDDAHRINQLNAYALRTGLLDERDPEALGRYFWHQLKELEAASYIYLGSPLGGAAGAGREDGERILDATDFDPERGLVAGRRREFAADPTGRRGRVLSAKDGFDARRRSWFQAAVGTAGPAWSDIYPLFADRSLALAASLPVYHDDGELRSVVAVDLRLDEISNFLRRLEIGKNGEVFIVERESGLLVATSTAREPFSVEGEAIKSDYALDREEPLIARTTHDLVARFGALHRIENDEQLVFDIAGERQFVQVTPLADGRGIDWLIVIVVPEADFMERIEANTRTTIWLCLAALMVATLLGWLTSRWIARPIVRLNEASKALARGQWEQRVEVHGAREVDELADSFNRMAGELRASFAELESRVAARTAELSEAKEAADAANRAKSRFLANISHELRTPLAAILGYQELLRERELPGEAETWVRAIRDNGKHLDHLLSDLLDISRIEAGRLELDVRPCELAELLAYLGSSFEPLAAESGLELLIETRGWLPWCFEADPVRLR